MRCSLLLTVVVLGIHSISKADQLPAIDGKAPVDQSRSVASQECDSSPTELQAATAAVLSDDAAAVAGAVHRLRTDGPPGLAALLEAHRKLLEGPAVPDDPRLLRLHTAVDAVGAQRDCVTSRLYWHTDLSAAVEAARRERKPILSLRLLGKLTDEFSCANSRYFRASLYSNREIGGYLRKHFILHWQSERPVPRVTIDFGDGRKLERTLTGNSIHYVLDGNARPFDALPGLYGPQSFLRALQRIEAGMEQSARLDGTARNTFLVRYHQERLQAIQQAWQRDLAELKITLPASAPPATEQARQAAAPGRRAGAVRAGVLAKSKSAGEFPVLLALAFSAAERLREATTDEVWLKLGALHQADAVLDEAGVALIRREVPSVDPQTGASLAPEEALAAMLENFQSAMAVDTVRNEYELHRRLHEWFATNTNWSLETLNEQVYAELFLTPRSDPWLGLVSPGTYTGLEKGGRRE